MQILALCETGWSVFEIGNWFKFGVKPIGATDYYIKLKQDNGLGLSYLPINENHPLPVNFGQWQQDFYFILFVNLLACSL